MQVFSEGKYRFSCGLEDEDDPFLEADMRMEVQSLIEKTMPVDGRCTVNEYLNGDADLPVCVDLDSESWQTDFLEQLRQEEQEAGSEAEENEEELDLDPPPPKIQILKKLFSPLQMSNSF